MRYHATCTHTLCMILLIASPPRNQQTKLTHYVSPTPDGPRPGFSLSLTSPRHSYPIINGSDRSTTLLKVICLVTLLEESWYIFLSRSAVELPEPQSLHVNHYEK